MRYYQIEEMLHHLASIMPVPAIPIHDGMNIIFKTPWGEIPARFNVVAESWEVVYGSKSWWIDDFEGALRSLEAELLHENRKVDIQPKVI